MPLLRAAALAIGRFFQFPLCWVAYFLFVLAEMAWLQALPWLKVNPFVRDVAALFLGVLYLRLMCCALLYMFKATAVSRSRQACHKFCAVVECIALYKGFGIILSLLTYLFATLNYPLVDGPLMKMDEAIGFDWLKGFMFYKGSEVLLWFYMSYAFQFFFMFLFAPFLVTGRRLYEVAWIFIIVLSSTAAISGFLPAFGPAYHYGLEEVFFRLTPPLFKGFFDLHLLRSHYTPDLSSGFTGIVMFPSFHAAGAIIFMYAFRDVRFVKYVFFLADAFMLAVTPYFGGHYLWDLAGGIAVAAMSIIFARWLFRRFSIFSVQAPDSVAAEA